MNKTIENLERKGFKKELRYAGEGISAYLIKEGYEIFLYTTNGFTTHNSSVKTILDCAKAINFILNDPGKAKEIVNNFNPINSTDFEETLCMVYHSNSRNHLSMEG